MEENMDKMQWDMYANLYNQGKGTQGDTNHQTLMQPILDAFLGNYTDLSILDAGCGNGFLANILCSKARKVFGIDSSEKLLDFARQNTHGGNIYFEKADLTQKLPFDDSEFDFVIANMVLQYLPDLSNFASESSRILDKNGKLVVVVDHPAHALFARAQGLSGKKNGKFLDIDSYFKPGLRKKVSLWDKAILRYYHRPLCDYVNSFAKFFRLASMIESSDNGEEPKILGLLWANAK